MNPDLSHTKMVFFAFFEMKKKRIEMRNRIIISLWGLLLMLPLGFCYANDNGYFNDTTNRNFVHDKWIKTVQFSHAKDELSLPILLLDSPQKLRLSFDDLKEDSRSFSYKIVQCDWDWVPLDNLFSDYQKGMQLNEFYDYYNSENTQVPYTHFRLNIPNEDIEIVQSGNYIIQVYDSDEGEDIILMQRRFQVVDPKVDIAGKVINSNLLRDKGRMQELFFDIPLTTLNISDPNMELHVVVTQNGRWDMAREVSPTFQSDKVLKYQNDPNLYFTPGNEFRAFTIRDEKAVNLNVEYMRYIKPYYHATLYSDRLRKGSVYQSNTDINGGFTVVADRTTDASTQADYHFVHFHLDLDIDLAEGIYIFGALTDWDVKKENRLYRVKGQKGYYGDLLLKEGIYNYAYGYKTAQDNNIDLNQFEGNHIETENQYQIWVFYSPIGSRYTQLIGFSSINSRK